MYFPRASILSRSLTSDWSQPKRSWSVHGCFMRISKMYGWSAVGYFSPLPPPLVFLAGGWFTRNQWSEDWSQSRLCSPFRQLGKGGDRRGGGGMTAGKVCSRSDFPNLSSVKETFLLFSYNRFSEK
jgi:hypothetical protein